MATVTKIKNPIRSKKYNFSVSGSDKFYGSELDLEGEVKFFQYSDGSAILIGKLKTPYGIKTCKCEYEPEMRVITGIPADGSDRDISFSWREAFACMRAA